MRKGEERRKTRRSRSETREVIARETEREEKQRASRGRAREGLAGGCWTGVGKVVVVAVMVGDNREIPWIRPHEEENAVAQGLE